MLYSSQFNKEIVKSHLLLEVEISNSPLEVDWLLELLNAGRRLGL
jgi:hypothetical protein